MNIETPWISLVGIFSSIARRRMSKCVVAAIVSPAQTNATFMVLAASMTSSPSSTAVRSRSRTSLPIKRSNPPMSESMSLDV